MADPGVLVSVRSSVRDRVRFGVRSYHPDSGGGPFVVLQLGDDVTMHVWDPDTLAALAATVAEARDLLSPAIAGQAPLPVDATPVPV